MSFQSQGGYVGFRTQAVKGTFLTPQTAGIFMKLRSGNLEQTRDLLIAEPEIGGIRDRVDAYLGASKCEGEYDFYGRMDSLATLWAAATGGTVTNTALSGVDVGAFRHDFTLIDTGSLPWLSVEENIADNYEHFEYTDVKVNKLHMESDANGYFSCKAGLVAITQTPQATARTVATSATTVFDNGPLSVGTNITVSYGGVNVPAKSWHLDIDNALDLTDFRLGSFFLGDVAEKRRMATAGFKVRPQDNTMLRQSIYGASGNNGVTTGIATKSALVITVSTYEKIVTTGSPTQVYSFQITIPKAVLKPIKVNPAKDDIIENDWEIEFLRPSVATPLFTSSIWNSKATIL